MEEGQLIYSAAVNRRRERQEDEERGSSRLGL